MKIIFNAQTSSINNNGGSKTLLRSAETLDSLGHNTSVISRVNYFTWFKPKCEILSLAPKYIHPETVFVAVSVMDLENTTQFYRMYKRVWYARAWAVWVNGEQWLIDQSKKFVNAGGKIIVNASWLVDQFKDKCDIDVELCFAGLDLDYWKKSKQDDVYTIGAMKYERHKTKRSDLIEKLKSHIIKENKYSFYTMGIDSDYGNSQVRDFYSCCDIIFTPTELEGFHNVGAEANLCGCLVFCNRMPSNGMGDYATEETAECFSGWDELLSKLKNPDFSKVPKMQKVLRERVGSREENMTKFVELIG